MMRMDCIFDTKETTLILKHVDSNTYTRMLTLYYIYMLYMLYMLYNVIYVI